MENKSVKLSLAATVLAMALVLVLLILGPRLIRLYADYRKIEAAAARAIVIAFYCCAAPAMAALLCLFRLLRNILHARVFLPQNSRLMALVSWCCLLVALISALFAWRYPPLLFVTLSMAFLFLIVRVVRNCFIAATALQEENRLTI